MEDDVDHELDGIAWNQLFRATVAGQRLTFVKAEHANVGPGWRCYQWVPGQPPSGLVDSRNMTDIEPLQVLPGAPFDRRVWAVAE